ncbi:hypothetical protein Ddc_04211 [Ditylenchus destructor]|nr:hypothetical protein Ddc_04211 [Ditylenchus destructor]
MNPCLIFLVLAASVAIVNANAIKLKAVDAKLGVMHFPPKLPILIFTTTEHLETELRISYTCDGDQVEAQMKRHSSEMKCPEVMFDDKVLCFDSLPDCQLRQAKISYIMPNGEWSPVLITTFMSEAIQKKHHHRNGSNDTDVILHRIESDIGQLRKTVDSQTNIEQDEGSYTRRYGSILIVADFALTVIAMVLYLIMWERNRARARNTYDRFDEVRNASPAPTTSTLIDIRSNRDDNEDNPLS